MTHQRQRKESRIPTDSDGPSDVLDRYGAVDRVILQELRDLARRNNAGRSGRAEATCDSGRSGCAGRGYASRPLGPGCG